MLMVTLSISDVPSNAVVAISYIGYKTQEISLSGKLPSMSF